MILLRQAKMLHNKGDLRTVRTQECKGCGLIFISHCHTIILICGMAKVSFWIFPRRYTCVLCTIQHYLSTKYCPNPSSLLLSMPSPIHLAASNLSTNLIQISSNLLQNPHHSLWSSTHLFLFSPLLAWALPTRNSINSEQRAQPVARDAYAPILETATPTALSPFAPFILV